MNIRDLTHMVFLSCALMLTGSACRGGDARTVKASKSQAQPPGTTAGGRKTPQKPEAPPDEPVDKILGEESYQCSRLIFDRHTQQPILKMDQYVDLRLSRGHFRTRIHIAEATADLTFEQCRILPKDGSDFSGWFVIECTKLIGLDGGPFSIDAFLADAYAGISPVITLKYAKFRTLADIGRQVGRGTPRRTIAFYANKKPVMEFLCYP